jgi:hypothetical protein
VGIGAAAVLWRTLRRPAPKPEPRPAPAAKPVPVLRTTAACDPGAPKVDVAGKLVVGPELVLGIHGDAGTQTVEADEPLIAAEVAE